MEQLETLFASGQMKQGFARLQSLVARNEATEAMRNHYELLVGLGYEALPRCDTLLIEKISHYLDKDLRP
jgi:hypothetical protein